MSDSTDKRIGGAAMWLRQMAAFALAAYGIWSLYSADPQVDGYLWVHAVFIWVGATVFFLGWQGHGHKTLLLTAGAWVGVMVPVAIGIVVLAMVVGALAGGDRDMQYIALAPIPIALYYVPKLNVIWPSALPVQSVTHHALRASFCLLQLVCAAVLFATLVIVKPGDYKPREAPAAEQSNITLYSTIDLS